VSTVGVAEPLASLSSTHVPPPFAASFESGLFVDKMELKKKRVVLENFTVPVLYTVHLFLDRTFF
jgi:hypothetical protein